MLLEQMGGKILCTQPRRLAVVAVSSRVAAERGVELGGDEVGYHIGGSRVAKTSTKLVFMTCGVLLEQIRNNGLDALSPYSCIVLDEVHERSTESDLVVALLREYMRKSASLRLLMMSATLNSQYEDYFAGITEDKLERLVVPQYTEALRQLLAPNRVQEHDLEDVLRVLQAKNPKRDPAKHTSLMGIVEAGKGLPAVQRLITDLIVHCHAEDPDRSHSILVFLPTWQTLEQQYHQITQLKLPLRVYALHSNIDMEDCIASMAKGSSARNQKRKIILATGIAESSITIDGCAVVIDSCRSLVVRWDRDAGTESTEINWISRSSATQRKGRTGRTCDGACFRLAPRCVFDAMEPYEVPQLRRCSLREETLRLLSSPSKVCWSVEDLYAACLDPPDLEIVEAAVGHLATRGMILKAQVPFSFGNKKKGRHLLTSLGGLIAQLPVSLQAGHMVVAGASNGLLRESIILAALLSTTPYPICFPWGRPHKFKENLNRFLAPHDRATEEDRQPPRATVLLGNLCAYEFWRRSFVSGANAANLNGIDVDIAFGSGGRIQAEQWWCVFHGLSFRSLRCVHEMVCSLWRFLYKDYPVFLDNARHEIKPRGHMEHKCGVGWGGTEDDACTVAVPGLANGMSVAEILVARTLVQQAVGDAPIVTASLGPARTDPRGTGTREVCVFFQRGRCTNGASCRFAHVTDAPKSLCKWHQLGNCRYGSSCHFSHGAQDQEVAELVDATPGMADPVQPQTVAARELFQPGDVILLLGEGDFAYTEALALFCPGTGIQVVATSLLSEAAVLETYPPARARFHGLKRASGVALCHNVDATDLRGSAARLKACLRDDPFQTGRQAFNVVVWNFPFTGTDEDDEAHQDLMRGFFRSLSAFGRLEGCMEGLSDLYLALQGDQFSRWMVREIAEEHFFALNVVYTPELAHTARRNDSADAFPVLKPRLYHFSIEKLPQSKKESLAFCVDVAGVGDKAQENAWKTSMREGHAEELD